MMSDEDDVCQEFFDDDSGMHISFEDEAEETGAPSSSNIDSVRMQLSHIRDLFLSNGSDTGGSSEEREMELKAKLAAANKVCMEDVGLLKEHTTFDFDMFDDDIVDSIHLAKQHRLKSKVTPPRKHHPMMSHTEMNDSAELKLMQESAEFKLIQDSDDAHSKQEGKMNSYITILSNEEDKKLSLSVSKD